MRRTLEPEILDTLSPDDPAALHNRRDLRIINAFMGNHRWLERELRRRLRPGERVLEIGAGTGELGRRLAAAGIAADGLDLWPRPADWPAASAWHRADLREFEGYGGYDVVVANLILHQFSEAELSGLGRRLAGRPRLILASEPSRQRLSQFFCAALGPVLGANFVTRHDSRVSIDAGFLDAELPGALGLDRTGGPPSARRSWLGACRAGRLATPPLGRLTMYLQSLATALPERSYTQAECWRMFEESPARQRLSKRSRLILQTLLRKDHGLERRRHFALPDIERVFDLSPDELNQAFRLAAPELAGRALRARPWPNAAWRRPIWTPCSFAPARDTFAPGSAATSPNSSACGPTRSFRTWSASAAAPPSPPCAPPAICWRRSPARPSPASRSRSVRRPFISTTIPGC